VFHGLGGSVGAAPAWQPTNPGWLTADLSAEDVIIVELKAGLTLDITVNTLLRCSAQLKAKSRQLCALINPGKLHFEVRPVVGRD
jgi:hypothetical protein